MRHLLRCTAIVAIVGMLAACSGLIPPQAIDDAFGLDGVEVTASTVDMAGAAVSPSAAGTSTTLTGSIETEVGGLGFPTLPGLLTVTGISDVITIRATVGVSAAGDVDLASSYTLTAASIALRISDGDAPLVDQSWASSGLGLSFSGSATYDPASDTTSGDYSVATQVPLVTLALQGSALRDFLDALQDGATLTVVGTMSVDVEPAFPSGASLTFTLQSLGGEISF